MSRYGIPALAFCLSLAACSANPVPNDDEDDEENGGTAGTGAMPTGGTGMGGSSGSPTGGTAGNAGSGGGATQPIPGGPYPFPQGKASGMCQLASNAGAAAAVASAWNYYKTNYIVAASPGLRVQRDSNTARDTVSEGMAYGMLAAVYMNDKQVFDGLYSYAKAHFDSYGLMNWHLNADGSVTSDGMGSATDADEDMAWALIMASAQWQQGVYLDEAKAMILAMSTHNIGPDGMLLPGDSWGSTDRTYPDYFSPAYFRVYAQVSGNRNWAGAILDKNYEILAAVSGTYGLVPDYTTRTYMHTTDYYYDACRTPWRIAMDYCFNGEPRAKAYLDKVGAFFNSQLPVTNIGDRYSLMGMKTSSNVNMAFIGPAGVAGMAGWPNLLNGAFDYGANGTGGNTQYYQQSLRVISMLMMSGNFLDYTKYATAGM